MNDLNDRLIELETRMVFQEDTLQQLNEVVIRQDSEILTLQQQLALLAKRFDEQLYAQEQDGVGMNQDERPPHY